MWVKTPLTLRTSRGPLPFRSEHAAEAGFLIDLLRSHALADLAAMPVDDAMKAGLLRMQYSCATSTYRAQCPEARFDIIEADGMPVERLITDPGGPPPAWPITR
jgi:hypothetical protein